MNRRDFARVAGLATLGALLGVRARGPAQALPGLAVADRGPLLGPCLAWTPVEAWPVQIQEWRDGLWQNLTELPVSAARYVVVLERRHFYTYRFRARHVHPGYAPGPWAEVIA